MTFKISFQKTPSGKNDTAVAFVWDGGKPAPAAVKIDKQWGGLIAHHLKTRKSFTGKRGQVMVLSAPKTAPWTRLVLLGLGDPAKTDPASLQTAGGKLYAALAGAGVTGAALFADGNAEAAAQILMGMKLRSYRFDKYKSKPKGDDAPALFSAVTVIGDAKIKKFFDPLGKTADGVFFARDLANEPPNVLYPESFARIVKKELGPLGVEVTILDEARLKKLGFGSHLSVGQGSARKSCAVVMRWKGNKKAGSKKQGPLAFVGKGVTFDTGGISIKPSAGMEDMKFDMCGAAAVAGLMKALALRKSAADVVGIAGLAENMPGSNASRPSDIVKSLSGKTIENLNTDAEGRLVLCDALTYIQRTYDPRLIVDLATLTGAIVVALGGEYAGAFVNNDDLWKKLDEAGKNTGEKLWRMPLDEAYRKSMESATADLRNTSTAGRDAGSCTAAGFLEHFIDKGRAWAHLDIAGTAWTKGDKPTAPKPAPGFGVLLLNRFVAGNYE